MLREGLLDGVEVVVAAVAPGPHGDAVAAELERLGAAVRRRAVDPFAEEAEPGPAPMLVWDGAASFAAAAGIRAVQAALDGAWLAIRATIGAEGGDQKIVLIGPPPGDAHAEAARAGLENLARTLSIEWSQRNVRTTTILAGVPAETAQLTAYLLSEAGDYFSGTALSLAGPGDLD